jgi:hypothetical protein
MWNDNNNNGRSHWWSIPIGIAIAVLICLLLYNYAPPPIGRRNVGYYSAPRDVMPLATEDGECEWDGRRSTCEAAGRQYTPIYNNRGELIGARCCPKHPDNEGLDNSRVR